MAFRVCCDLSTEPPSTSDDGFDKLELFRMALKLSH